MGKSRPRSISVLANQIREFGSSQFLVRQSHIIKLNTDTELARAVDVVMARAKRIHILIIKVNKLFSFFSSWCFLKEIENMYFVFLSSYTNTRQSLGELEKAVETLACGSCSHSVSRSPKLPLVFL